MARQPQRKVAIVIASSRGNGRAIAGGRAHAVRAEASAKEIARLFDETEAALGPPDIVVADIADAIGNIGFVVQQAARRMRKHGRIVLICANKATTPVSGDAACPEDKRPTGLWMRAMAQAFVQGDALALLSDDNGAGGEARPIPARSHGSRAAAKHWPAIW